MAIKRSVYDTAKRIIDEKGKWHTAKSKGEDTSPYANAAVPYYQQLEDNGAGDIAEKLRNSDYTQALDYLNTLEVEDDPVDYATQLNDFRKGVNAKSDKTFSTIETDKNALSKDYDDYISYLKEGYTGKDYAKTLLDQYNEMGQRASLGELAGTGAENAGNIDSYAKAQAQRQQLAYANAGNAAALDQYNAIMGNYLAGLEGKRGMTAGAWGAMQENASSDQGLYSDMYKSFIAGEADKEVAKQNALVAEYEARVSPYTQVQNAMSDWVLEYTKKNGSGPSEAEYNSVYAQYAGLYGVPSVVVPNATQDGAEDTSNEESSTGVEDDPRGNMSGIINSINSLGSKQQRADYITRLEKEGTLSATEANRLRMNYNIDFTPERDTNINSEQDFINAFKQSNGNASELYKLMEKYMNYYTGGAAFADGSTLSDEGAAVINSIMDAIAAKVTTQNVARTPAGLRTPFTAKALEA